MSPKLHASARKHFGRDRLTDESVLYAYEHALNSRPLDDEDDPRRWLVVGIDQSGRILEMVVLIFDSGGELLIHAMKARPQFLEELRKPCSRNLLVRESYSVTPRARM